METRLAPTHTPAALDAAVAGAVAELRAGNPVALPTETVYGLAADALRPDAVVKIFEAKERPLFDPLIVHLPNEEWLDRITAIPLRSRDLVARLIRRFWPGPLTIVLPRRDNVPDLVTAGLPTVAVRMSAHAVFREVCSEFGRPLAAPSANRFGRISPTTAAHVNTELGGRIPLILDGGATEYGLESTIVKVDGSALRLLRAGPITADDFAAVWKEDCEARGHIPDEAEVTQFFAGLGVDFHAMLRGQEKTTVEAPGQLASHYAPRTPLRLVSPGTHFAACGGSPRFGSLAFSMPSDAANFAREEILSPTRDLREAAATLFAKLRRLDEAGLDLILAEPVPETGLGIAIMDRLRKAAAQNV
ncbi:MAG TPA: L-threonylcarbamoyladenylate synthase [Chthoniobacteraceae bacterium]|nr:L-threonylcarbamoyladenylate synthase [Chthoniobacteraceae bacterium]